MTVFRAIPVRRLARLVHTRTHLTPQERQFLSNFVPIDDQT